MQGVLGRVVAEALGALAFPLTIPHFLNLPYHSHPSSAHMCYTNRAYQVGPRKPATSLFHSPQRPPPPQHTHNEVQLPRPSKPWSLEGLRGHTRNPRFLLEKTESQRSHVVSV